jgi:hypothetical protein
MIINRLVDDLKGIGTDHSAFGGWDDPY